MVIKRLAKLLNTLTLGESAVTLNLDDLWCWTITRIPEESFVELENILRTEYKLSWELKSNTLTVSPLNPTHNPLICTSRDEIHARYMTAQNAQLFCEVCNDVRSLTGKASRLKIKVESDKLHREIPIPYTHEGTWIQLYDILHGACSRLKWEDFSFFHNEERLRLELKFTSYTVNLHFSLEHSTMKVTYHTEFDMIGMVKQACLLSDLTIADDLTFSLKEGQDLEHTLIQVVHCLNSDSTLEFILFSLTFDHDSYSIVATCTNTPDLSVLFSDGNLTQIEQPKHLNKELS